MFLTLILNDTYLTNYSSLLYEDYILDLTGAGPVYQLYWFWNTDISTTEPIAHIDRFSGSIDQHVIKNYTINSTDRFSFNIIQIQDSAGQSSTGDAMFNYSINLTDLQPLGDNDYPSVNFSISQDTCLNITNPSTIVSLDIDAFDEEGDIIYYRQGYKANNFTEYIDYFNIVYQNYFGLVLDSDYDNVVTQEGYCDFGLYDASILQTVEDSPYDIITKNEDSPFYALYLDTYYCDNDTYRIYTYPSSYMDFGVALDLPYTDSNITIQNGNDFTISTDNDNISIYYLGNRIFNYADDYSTLTIQQIVNSTGTGVYFMLVDLNRTEISNSYAFNSASTNDIIFNFTDANNFFYLRSLRYGGVQVTPGYTTTEPSDITVSTPGAFTYTLYVTDDVHYPLFESYTDTVYIDYCTFQDSQGGVYNTDYNLSINILGLLKTTLGDTWTKYNDTTGYKRFETPMLWLVFFLILGGMVFANYQLNKTFTIEGPLIITSLIMITFSFILGNATLVAFLLLFALGMARPILGVIRGQNYG